MVGTSHHNTKKKSPDNRASSPSTGAARLNKLQMGGTPMQFVSHFSLQLRPAQIDDIIKECRPAGIKASSGETPGGMQQGRSCETSPWADQGPPDHCRERPERDPTEESRLHLKGHLTQDGEGARPEEDAEGWRGHQAQDV